MPWLTPAVIAAATASLLAALFYCYLYSQEKDRSLAIWAASWAVYSLRFFFQFGLLHQFLPPGWLVAQQVASIGGALLFVWGCDVFLRRPVARLWLAGAAASALWAALATSPPLSFAAYNLPVDLYAGLAYGWSGWQFLRHSGAGGRARHIVGWSLILYGLHKVDYSFLRPVLWFAPWGFLLAALLFLAAALGIMLLYYERIRVSLQREIDEKKMREERFRSVVESSRDAIVLTDDQGRIIAVNQGAGEMFGYEPAALAGRPLTELMPERYHRDHCQGLARFAATGRSAYLGRTMSLHGRRRDGNEFPVDLNVAGWTSGGRRYFSGILRDMTAYRTVEAELRRSNVLLQAVIEGSTDAIFVKDLAGRYLLANEGSLQALGRGRAAVLGRNDAELFPEASARVIAANDQLVLAGETIFKEEELTTAQGETVWLVAKYPYRDEAGHIIGLIGISRNITELRRADQEVRARERLLADVFDSIQDGISVLDLDLNILRVNHTMRQMYSHRLPIEGRKCYAVYQDRETACDNCPTTRALASGRLEHAEVPYLRPAGPAGILDLFAFPMHDETGRVSGVVEFVRDITARKEAQQERARLEGRLRQAQKMEAIGTLAGGIAHDFNNILSPIIGYTELVKEQLPAGDELRADLDEVLRAAGRAKDLVKQILSFSRAREQEQQPLNVVLIAKEAIKLLKASLPSNIEIRSNIPAAPQYVQADPTQMHQVIINLCTNAYQAMQEKGGVLELELRPVEADAERLKNLSLQPGAHLELTVRDSGSGMDPDILGRIFEPYFTTKQPGEGTGLGLAVVHGIVRAAKGDIAVSSEKGQGSVFRVYLPLLQRGGPESAGSPEKPAPTGNQERILFVDDEEMIGRTSGRLLEKLGYLVTLFTSSTEALAEFSARPDDFDLIITDQTMPEMTGDRLVVAMKAIRPTLPVILCTGFSSMINAEKAAQLGVQAFLQKPVLRRDLAEVVRQVLDARAGSQPSGEKQPRTSLS